MTTMVAPKTRAVKASWSATTEPSPVALQRCLGASLAIAVGRSKTAYETAQPKKSGKVSVALMTARSTGVERIRGRRPFSSQVGEQGFHFKLNIWRQSPQSLPTQHAESLFASLSC
jgi:hypothetical protein